MKKTTASVTGLIREFQSGDKEALDRLLPLVYRELKKIAQNKVSRLPSVGNTFSATALVHEAYLKIRDMDQVLLKDRAHFYAVAAQCMRWLLIDYARARRAGKREVAGGDVAFDEKIHWIQNDDLDLQALEDALSSLGRRNARLGKVAELRFLLGLSIEETAEALGTSTGTVKRDWALARAFLTRALK